MVIFYKITRGTGSVRHEPVHYGEPVRAVMVHVMGAGIKKAKKSSQTKKYLDISL